MGDILDFLNDRHRSEVQGEHKRHIDLRSTVSEKLRPLAQATITQMRTDGFMHRGSPGEFTTLTFAGSNQAAWLVREWPGYDLPRTVERYAVYVVESGQHVSVRRMNGGELIESYHPDKYSDKLEELLTVYRATAKLPRNYEFEKEWTSFME